MRLSGAETSVGAGKPTDSRGTLGGVQATNTALDPWILTRFANSCISDTSMLTPSGWLHDTLPLMVATPCLFTTPTPSSDSEI